MKAISFFLNISKSIMFLLLFQLYSNNTFAQVTNNKIYYIQVRHSGKVLDVKDLSKNDNGNIQQWSKKDGRFQQFKLTKADDGSYFIQNTGSGKYLDVVWGSKDNGANVQQYKFHGGANQRFFLKKAFGDYYYIVNKNSGKNLDVAYGSKADGANIQQFANNGKQNQQFKFILAANTSTLSQGLNGQENTIPERIVSLTVTVRTTTDNKEDAQFELLVKQGQTIIKHFKEGGGENWDEGDNREFSSNENLPLTGQNISVVAALQDGPWGRSNHWDAQIVVTVKTSENRFLEFSRACAFRTAENRRRHEFDMGSKTFARDGH